MQERFYICEMGDRYRIWVAQFKDGKYVLGSLKIFKELHHHQDWNQDASLYSLFSFQE